MKVAFILPLLIGALQLEAQFSKTDFKKLYSLAGTWIMKKKNTSTIETWILVNDSSMSGASYTVKGKDSTLQETVKLTLRNGLITYTPVTRGQNNELPV